MLSRWVRTSSISDGSPRWTLHKKLQTLCCALLRDTISNMCLPEPSGLSVLLFLWRLCADRDTLVQHHWYVKESSKTMLCPPVAFPEMKVFDCHFVDLQDF